MTIADAKATPFHKGDTGSRYTTLFAQELKDTRDRVEKSLEGIYKETSGDSAMVTDPLGGIDFDPANIKMETQGSAEKFNFSTNFTNIKNLQSSRGFSPVISTIQSVNNIFQLLNL